MTITYSIIMLIMQAVWHLNIIYDFQKYHKLLIYIPGDIHTQLMSCY